MGSRRGPQHHQVHGRRFSLTTIGQTQEPMTLRWYLDVLSERWRVVIASTVVGAVLAVLFLTLSSDQVTARTVVRLDVIAATPFERNDAASRLIDSETEVALASSFEVSSRAAASLADGTTSREIQESTSVSSVLDATVINVRYTAGSEEAAMRGADAVANAYLQYRSDEAQAQIDAYASLIEDELATARLELASLAERRATYEPDSPLALQAEVDRSIALQALSALTNQRYELASIDATAGSIISPASENPVVYSPSTRLVLMGGVFGGLLVGAALAFVRNATAKRVSNLRQLGVHLGAPSLGSVEIGQAGSHPEAISSGEARAVGVRLLAELPIGLNSLAAIDVTDSDDVSLAPFIVAASVAELGETATVVVAGATREELDRVVAAFDLHVVDTAAGLPRYASSLNPGMHVVCADAHEGRTAFAEVINRSTVSTPGGNRSGFAIIVVSGRADEETRILALGEAEAVVVFVALGRTQRSAIEGIAEMSARFGKRVLGAVTVTGKPSRSPRQVKSDGNEHALLESPNGPPAATESAPAVGRL
jgi:uncharacterized protein involved in exopolysaccharide biosynthesis